MHRVTGKFEVIQDSLGADYLALSVDETTVLPYIKFLASKIPLSFIENQKKRDFSKHHVTVLNVIQLGAMRKHHPEMIEGMLDEFSKQEPVFYCHGIGQVKAMKKQSKEDIENGLPVQEIQAFFMVLENEKISELRLKYFPDWQHQALHCTLAFDKQDVHGKDIDKGISSLIYKDEEILNTKISSKLK